MLKKQLLNFILVGIMNTIFGYTVYALLITLGSNYILAVLFATILGILFNFKTIGKYVFGSHKNNLIFKFISVYVIVFIINILIIKICKTYGFNDYTSGAVALFPSATVSFVLNKFYVFER